MTTPLPPVDGPRHRLPGARLAVGMLLAVNLLNYIDRFVLAAVEPLIRRELFAPDDPNATRQMGLLATAFLVSYMVVAPIFGWLGDRWKRWAIIGTGVIIWSAATAGSGLATTFGTLLLLRVIVGVGEGAYGPIAPTILSDLYPVEKRGAVLSWFYLAIPVGSALGYVIGGAMANLRIGDWQSSWHWAFFVVAPPGLILGIWCFFLKDPPRGLADGGARPRKATLADLKILWRTPSYVYNLLGMTAMTFAIGGLAFWMPAYIAEYRMNSAGDAKVLQKVNGIFGPLLVVTGLIATLSGGYLSDRLRSRYGGAYFITSGIGMLIGFPCFIAVLFAPFPLAWVFMGLAMFFLFFNTGPTNTIIANVTDPRIRATAYAVSIFGIHAFGDAISPPIMGAIVDATKSPEKPLGNWTLAFFIVGIAMAVSGGFWLMGARHLKRDTELATTRLPA